ncbi:MAG TPA: hypothetical protein VGJ46_03060 [Candidatus Limnocylindrales bacterium]
MVLDPVSELEREARLSASTWPSERDQLPDGGKVFQLAELLRAPNQTGRAAWEVGDGWSSRKVEALFSKLEETDWLTEVLDPVLAKIPDLGANEIPGRLREKDLTGLRRGADAGGQVDVQAYVALVGRFRLASVNPDAHTYRSFASTRHDFERCRNGVRGLPEDGKGAVSFSIDSDSTVGGRDRPDRSSMAGEQLPIIRSQLPEQSRRARDVGEQERERAGRKRT